MNVEDLDPDAEDVVLADEQCLRYERHPKPPARAVHEC